MHNPLLRRLIAPICVLLLVFITTPPITTAQTTPELFAEVPHRWYALPNNGLQATVQTMVRAGNDIYVGGNFSGTFDGVVELNYIARYDTTTDTWSALPNGGLSGPPTSMHLIGKILYVGGNFNATDDGTITLNRIAAYNLLTDSWSALSNGGLNALPHAFANSGSILYVGGSFTATNDTTITLNRVAKYDTDTGTWSALAHNGLNSDVTAMTVIGTNLYVGGSFTQTFNGAVINLFRLARYNTSANTWGVFPNNGLGGPVFELLPHGTDLYAAGSFTQTADGTVTNINRVVRYNTVSNTWSALGPGLDNNAIGLAIIGDNLFAGGSFLQTADGSVTSLNRVARYDLNAGTWHRVAHLGVNNSVNVLASDTSDLYVGGVFTVTGDGVVQNLNRIARYNLGEDPPVDYNGDGRSEVTVFRAGAWHLYNFTDGTVLASIWTGMNSPTARPIMMDYNGDIDDDLTVYDSGAWHFFNPDGSYNKGLWVAFNAIPVPADYDGDGDDDLMLFDNGAWHKFNFFDGAYLGGTWTGTGAGSPAYPAPMDYDGDGSADFTVYNSGAWHFFNDDGSYNKGLWVSYTNAIPVPGDYNGDGTDDVVLYELVGAWHWFDFATGNYVPSRSIFTAPPPHKFGGTTMPAPLDYNADGVMDRTLYAGGPWHFFSGSGVFIKNIPTGGVLGDIDISGRPQLP